MVLYHFVVKMLQIDIDENVKELFAINLLFSP